MARRTPIALAALALAVVLLAIGAYSGDWLGLPTILGAAAISLGLVAREKSDEQGKATAGNVLGALAVVTAVVLAFVG